MRKLWMMYKTASVLSLSFFLIACSVGPDYEKPTMDVPDIYKEAAVGTWKVATPRDPSEPNKWWLVFNDGILNDLEEQATTANPTIAIAQAQYDQALALVDQAVAAFFPVISATLGETKSGTHTPRTSTTPATNTKITKDSIGGQVAWEIDVWGKIRRQVESQEASAESFEALLAGARLSIQATVAQNYYLLRALDEAQTAFDESVAGYEKFLTITRNQFKAGITSDLAVLQAEAQLQAITVQSMDNFVARAQLEHAIAVLLNKPPSQFFIAKIKTDLVPPEVPVSVPSTVLERRPDVMSAERKMAAANAQIGVAVSAYFPVLNLTGSQINSSNSFAKLFSSPAIVWALGAQLTQNIFQGGATMAAVEAADAGYHATVASYRFTVLGALQDVEDSLSTSRILKNERVAQVLALQTAEKQLSHTMFAYKEGTASTLDSLNALFTVYTAKRNLVSIAGRQMTSAVALIKSMG
jgi:NodT family efflux transporter outer membrane factor (OMF) lipoprotein